MRVAIAADHAGYELKQHLGDRLPKQGYDVVDVGAASYDPADDYPAYCFHAASRVVAIKKPPRLAEECGRARAREPPFLRGLCSFAGAQATWLIPSRGMTVARQRRTQTGLR